MSGSDWTSISLSSLSFFPRPIVIFSLGLPLGESPISYCVCNFLLQERVTLAAGELSFLPASMI
jgi:hypothetical protein